MRDLLLSKCADGFEAPVHLVTENEVRSFREREKQEVVAILHDCGEICKAAEVPFQTIQVQNESITEGIMELICHLSIRKLVMGAAANSAYSRRMSTPVSKKANYVLRSAPEFCHIWFVCSNHLVFTREERARKLTEKTESTQLNRSDSTEFQFWSQPLASASGDSSPSSSMHHGSSSPTSTTPPNFVDILYAQLQQVQKEFKVSANKLHRELRQRQKAEKEALEANLKVQAAEKDLTQMKEELKDTNTRLVMAVGRAFNASAQLVSFESETEKLRLKLKETEKNLESSENSQKMYKKIYVNLQTKFDDTLHVAQGSETHIPQHVPIFSYEYSLADLEKATNSFDPCLIIEEGGYGDVYRGFLNHTEVAIKTRFPSSFQGPCAFRREVNVLTNLRHPNLVTLVGTCPESRGLIYEYLPNGSLQDRLICKNNTPPLPWQIRIRIATELCSVLNFLHSRKPNSVIHADINPANVLLDSNFVCKLSGFGSCLFIPSDKVGLTESRQPTFKIDVYSFGIILLCLLTAEFPPQIVEMVQYALENDDFYSMLDHSAGDWPFVRAKQLAHMALRCCHTIPDERPDLASEVWMMLKPSNDPTRSLSNPVWRISDDQVPSYFICPILQEIMHDPHFAADGFTYEASAIKVWFESGHDSSPMTNLKLANRLLTPNRALHSAIQEWQQKHKSV
ncbi:hypothetical protein RND81_02G124000 [Saponaria officinalis]|uniref:RING-type E3 ubiquitin transferase n=1 Tax=Saponaria officinalis TaxID=3572 RepID=A0AAW1MT14_SAPOF